MSVNMVLSPLPSHNGCPLLSFTTHSHRIGCGAFKSAKLVAGMCGRNAKGVMSSLMKLYAKDQRIGEAIRCSIRNSYEGLGTRALPASNAPVIQITEEVSSYQFRTENGDLLKVVVGKKNDKYSLLIKVLSLQISRRENGLVMSWGRFRSDSSSFMPLDFQGSSLDGKTITMETPFMLESDGTLAV